MAAGNSTTEIDPRPVVPLAMPANVDVSKSLQLWAAASRPFHTLVVTDLSGSMSEVAAGQSKIQLAAAAEQTAIDFFPDSSWLGLWGFSSNRSSGQDWTEYVALGPVGSNVGASTRRQALIQAAARLPALTGGDTALYNTALAAYESVRKDYDAKAVNSVVLITDGANTTNYGVGLATLLRRLRTETSPDRPLTLITIAVGTSADVATCKEISQATNAPSYAVAKPSDIRAVYLDAITRAP